MLNFFKLKTIYFDNMKIYDNQRQSLPPNQFGIIILQPITCHLNKPSTFVI